MKHDIAIFKIGGKILDNSKDLINTIAQLTQLYEDQIIKKILLIPGGGILANFIRELYYEFQIDDDFAHWMAIYSMNYNGVVLNKKFPHLNSIENLDQLKKEGSYFSIFLPYKYLKNNDELPHSWSVTSDSIALYMAYKLGMNECFLLKDVDGIIDKNQNLLKELSTTKFEELKAEGKLAEFPSEELYFKTKSKPLDSYILTLIEKYKIPCIILNGASQELRIFKYFRNADNNLKIYTKISPVYR